MGDVIIPLPLAIGLLVLFGHAFPVLAYALMLRFGASRPPRVNRSWRTTLVAAITFHVISIAPLPFWLAVALVLTVTAWYLSGDDDDHWRRRGPRLATYIRKRVPLAHGIPARRPTPA